MSCKMTKQEYDHLRKAIFNDRTIPVKERLKKLKALDDKRIAMAQSIGHKK